MSHESKGRGGPFCVFMTQGSQNGGIQDSNEPVEGGKVYPSADAALWDLPDGAVVLVGGFAGAGVPETLLKAILDREVGNLTCICQGAWFAGTQPAEFVGVDRLVAAGLVIKIVAPLPFLPDQGDRADASATESRWRSGSLEIEVVPQGELAERLRAGGAGLGGVFLPERSRSDSGESTDSKTFSGIDHVFHPPLKADFALLKAATADTMGNLVYQGAQRNWNPVMAMAATVTVVEAVEILEPGGLDPELVITPGIFVNRLVPSL